MRDIVLAAVGLVALGLAPAASAAEPSVATVGSTTITRAQLEAHVRPKLVEIENERYEALKDGVDERIGDELFKQEAKARNVTPEQLEKTEIAAKVTAPTDPEIQKEYDENKAELGNAPLDSLKSRIVA